MNNNRERWLYTLWVIAETVLYLGLLALSLYLNYTGAHLWVKLLVHALEGICVITGVFLFYEIMKRFWS